MTPEARFEELNELAFRDAPVPDTRSQADILAFQELRNLYWFARQHGISGEQGKKEKERIKYAYMVNQFLEEMQERTNQMWKEIDIASSEYRKNPTIENADALLFAIYKTGRKI